MEHEQLQESIANYETHNSNKDYEKAEDALFRAISIAETLQKETILANLYINLSGLYRTQCKYNQAIDWCLKALKLAEKIGDKDLLGIYTVRAGNLCMLTLQHDKAIHYLRRALRILPTDSPSLQDCYINLAGLNANLHNFSLAIGYAKKAIKMMEKIDNKRMIAIMHCNIAFALFDYKKFDKAIQYVSTTQKYVEDNEIDSPLVKQFLNHLYLRVYDYKGDIPKVEYYIQQLLKFENLSPWDLLGIYETAYIFYSKHQKYEHAFEYIQKFMSLQEEVRSEETKNNIAIKTANFEYEREKLKAELLKQKNDELEEYQKIIEQKNTELSLMNSEKDNLMNTISHDLKNYLGATQQAMDIFYLKEPDHADNKYLKMVTTSNSRSLNLVKEILYSSKVTATKDSLTLQSVDINQIIAENEDILHLRGSKKGIFVIFEYTPEPLMVELDCEKWHRIFENLTTNAIKFTPTGKEICISTKKEGNYARISIKDSGIGIPPENIGKLFTPFSGVGRKGTEGEESTGLGLSIVKHLVELHKGKIEVHSEVGKGTEFVVKLQVTGVR